MKVKTMIPRRLLSVLLVLCLLLGIAPLSLAASRNDIQGHWAQGVMEQFAEAGYLKGNNAGAYLPDNYMTRAEFFALINRIKGFETASESVSQYTDVAQHAWYYSDVAKALAAGYTSGISATEMAPGATITREQGMVMIARLLGLPEADASLLAQFGDANKVSSKFTGAVAAMVEHGYVVGNSEKQLQPGKALTRAEGVAMLSRVLEALLGITEIGEIDTPLSNFPNTGNS